MKRGKGDLAYYPSSPLLLSPAWLTGSRDHRSQITRFPQPRATPSLACFLPFAVLTRGTSRRPFVVIITTTTNAFPSRISDTKGWSCVMNNEMLCHAGSSRYDTTQTPTKSDWQGTKTVVPSTRLKFTLIAVPIWTGFHLRASRTF